MAKFPFQLLTKHDPSKNKGKSLTCSGPFKGGRHLAVFDRDFCQGAKPLDFIGQTDTLMDEGQSLKNDDTSYVSRVRWNSKDIVVKRYNHRGLIHSLRHTIKKSRARRGWFYGHWLRTLNIATPKPLAYVEHYKGLLLWESYLVTEYVEGQNLYYFLQNDNATEEKQSKKIKQVFEMFDKMGEYRISHGDLKHSNILITENGPVLTDLDSIKAHKFNRTYEARRAKDLKHFLRKTDVSPELNSYCRKLILEKMKPVRKLTCDFDKIRMYNWTIYAHKDFPKHNIRQLALTIDKPNGCRSQFVKVPSSDYSRVFRYNISFNDVEHILYLKQYLCRSVWDFAKHLFRPSRAKRAFKASLMLQKNGFDAPAVIALLERCLGPLRTDNLLLTGKVEKARPIEEVFTDICQSCGENALIRKRTLIKSFAETVGRMHAKGIFHGDLRLGNVLARQVKDKWEFFFLDNERTRKFGRLPTRLRLKNLVQVNMHYGADLTNSDRIRFYRTYLQENINIQSKYKILARKAAEKTRKRLKSKLPTNQL
jgi:tRNA A-37 threonylcarbamoyl transferase component Bud32